jgi:replication-associated recombination protein RarA
VKDIREAVEKARESRKYRGTKTILFVDEIHRFNQGQQDALLPHVEEGTVTLIGATTENPSFELNRALLSRTPEWVKDECRTAWVRARQPSASFACRQRWPGPGATLC